MAKAVAGTVEGPASPAEDGTAQGEPHSSVPIRIVVLTSLFPSAAQPNAGVFIRERMFRVAQTLPLVVVAPQPWFPFQAAIRHFRHHWRPPTARHERQSGVDVHFPRFLAVPGFLRRLDGLSMAVACLPLMLRLRRRLRFTLIDAHFAYPSGDAATLLGRWLGVPVTITLRGTETGHLARRDVRHRVVKALSRAARVLAVSDSLRRVALDAGVASEVTAVIGNGVDLEKFRRVDRKVARSTLRIDEDARVLVSVGGLVERKGFHRVLEVMPALLREFPDLLFLIVGGASPEGDMRDALARRVDELDLGAHVRFLGALPPERLHVPLSAADVFVLATRYEGWANVLLEAMACGLPVVTTDVGGNREVVRDRRVGIVVPFGDAEALQRALIQALREPWDHSGIVDYARANAWETRIPLLVEELTTAVVSHRGVAP